MIKRVIRTQVDGVIMTHGEGTFSNERQAARYCIRMFLATGDNHWPEVPEDAKKIGW